MTQIVLKVPLNPNQPCGCVSHCCIIALFKESSVQSSGHYAMMLVAEDELTVLQA